MPHKPGIGAIFGIVSEDGVPKQGAPVYLLDMRRDVGVGKAVTLAKQFTASDGGFVFNGLDVSYPDYACFATDEDGVTPKNAMIFDRVQPVSAHSGSRWLFNWRTQSCLYGAVVQAFPYPVLPALAPRSFEVGGGMGRMMKPNTADTAPSIVGAAISNETLYPQFSVTADSAVFCFGKSPVWGTAATFTATVEWVLDVSTATGEPALFAFEGFGKNSSYYGIRSVRAYDLYTGYATSGAMFVLQYLAATKKLRIFVKTGFFDTETFRLTYSTLAFEVDVAAFSGLTHFAYVYNQVQQSVFVNGVMVASRSDGPLVSGAFMQYSDGIPAELVFGKVQTSATVLVPSGQAFDSGLGAAYTRALSASEVQALYSCLFTGALPVVSGYARKVFEFQPVVYYRLNDALIGDAVGAGAKDWVSYGVSTTSHLPVFGGPVSSVVTAEPSPVLGGASVRLQAQAFLHAPMSAPVSFASRHEMSFCGWLKLASAPSATTAVFEVRNSADRRRFWLECITGGQFRVSFEVNNASVTTGTFSAYTAPLNTWLFVAVTFSFYDTAREVKLWVGTDTTAPVVVDTLTFSNGFLNDSAVDDSYAASNRSTYIGYAFDGWLCELAMFHQCLSAQNISDLWDARLMV